MPWLFKRLLGPTLLLLVLLIPGWPLLDRYGAEARELSQRVVFWILGSAIGLSVAWLLVRLIDVCFWAVLEKRLQSPVPRLLRDIGAGIVFLIAGITIVSLVFRQSVTGLWATSGVVGLVVGLAVRNMIADVFSGIALNIDRPFKIGDWVEVHPRSIEPKRGCVAEISWRSTRIRTTDNTMVILPNSLVSSIVVVNLSAPETRSRFELTFCLEFGIPTERAMRILTAGVKAAPGLLTDPPPKVLVNHVTQWGVEYKVRYWLEPKEVSPRQGRHRVTASILEHLYHAGITLAYPKQDLFLSRMPSRQLDRGRDRSEIIRRIELFSHVPLEDIRQLAAESHERRFLAGDVIVEKDRPGDSMFVVVEGLLDVCTTAEATQERVKVVEIEPGQFFGEMSLLTGAPRAATVLAVTDAIVYEIGKDTIDQILAKRPELAQEFAQTVARRQEELHRAGRLPIATPLPDHPTLTRQILERMKSFFSSLKGKWLPS
jgi:small-conductance mechanosensitive channel